MHARRQAARQTLKMRLGSQADARTYNSNLIMPLNPHAVSQGPRPSGTCPAVAGEGRLSNLIIKQVVDLHKVLIVAHLYPERVHVDSVL